MFFINELINIATSVGDFDGLSTQMDTEVVVTQLVDDLSIEKVANRTSWATGNLTYTITIDNESTTLPYENPVVTDTIDPTKATLVENTVTINGDPATTPTDYTFDAVSGLLSVSLPNVDPSTTATVEFDVRRV